MGQTESLINVGKDDWPDVLLTALLANFVLAAAHIPIWNSPHVLRSYKRQKNWYRKYLLNPRWWYEGFIWWLVLLFGAAWGIYRMLKILRNSKSGEDTEKIYHAEIALLIASIQLGIHGMWAIGWFYWRQAFWSIFTMALATLVAVGAYIPMLLVDPLTAGITYGIYILAQLIFVIGNTYLFVRGYDPEIDRIKNPLSLYLTQKLYPVREKPRKRKTQSRGKYKNVK